MTELKKCMAAALREAGFEVELSRPWNRADLMEREKICISVKKLTAIQGAAYRYLGTDETGAERYGMALTMEAALTLLSPKENGGSGCEEFLERVLFQLMQGVQGLPVAEISCGDARYDGLRDCFSAEILIQSRVMAYGSKAEEETMDITEFKILPAYQ